MLFSGETAPPPPFGNGTWVDDTWMYKPANGWGDPGTNPFDLYGPAAFDPAANRIVALNYTDVIVNTYDPTTKKWSTEPAPGNQPSGVLGGGFVYDAAADRLILFGGFRVGGQKLNNETWAYDFGANKWTQLAPAASPSARNFGAMAYDDKIGKVVMFGGGDINGDALGDTWTYDYSKDTWTKMTPSAGPSPRDYSAMVYDPKSDQMVLFGGMDESNSQALGDTWTYQPATDTWTQIHPASAPSARAFHGMAYEAASGEVVLFGGGPAREQPLGDTWLFVTSTGAWAAG